jgi:hypothetical protein
MGLKIFQKIPQNKNESNLCQSHPCIMIVVKKSNSTSKLTFLSFENIFRFGIVVHFYVNTCNLFPLLVGT